MELSITLERHLNFKTLHELSIVTNANIEYMTCCGSTWNIRRRVAAFIDMTIIEQSVTGIITDREIIELRIQLNNPTMHLKEIIGSDHCQF